jgi:glycerophosphoryl diester phosphodiesterase
MKNSVSSLTGVNYKSIVRLWIGDVCYRLVALSLLIEISELAVKVALKIKGYSYLTNANMFSMLTSPAAIAMLLAVFIMALIMTLAETAALVIGLAEVESGNGISWGRIIFGGIKGVKKLKHKSYMLLTIPATIMQLIIMLWIRVRYIYELEQVGFVSTALVVLFILVALVAFLAETVVACMIVENMPAKKAWYTVLLVLKHQKKYLFKDLAILNLVIAAVSYITYIVLVVLITLVVVLVMPSGIQLAMTMTISNYIARFLTLLYLNAATVINLYIITKWCIPKFVSHDGREELHSLCLLSGYEDTILYKKKKLVFSILGIVSVAFLLFYGYRLLHNGMITAERALTAINISSHRGASRQAPENTLPAIEAAIENMADYAEIDVQESSDGRVVLMHDLSLMRTAGEDLYVSDLSFRQLRRYDVGSWFSGDFIYTRIPTLAEVLQVTSGKIGLNIELKRTKSGDDLAEKVVGLVRQYGIEDKVVISSSDYKYLRQIKNLNESLTTGYILTSLMGGGYDDKNIDFYSIKYSYVSASVVDKIHSSGKGIHVWTVNKRSSIERMKRYGVDNIITDNPVLAREVIYDNGAAATIFDIFKRIL